MDARGDVRLAQYDGPRLRGFGLRRALPPRMLQRQPPREARKEKPRIKPSEALRLAQRRWPNSTALAVDLRGKVYVVKLKAGSRLVQVRVDARTGRVSR